MKRQDEYAQMIRDRLTRQDAESDHQQEQKSWKDWLQQAPSSSILLAIVALIVVLLLFVR